MAEEHGTGIDRLDIEIAANANTADTALKKLSKYLQGVTAALKGMTKGLNEQAKEAEQSADGTEKTAESVKELSKNAKNATGFMGKFVKSIRRIAFYRAIRTVIKAVSSSIKEGLTNLKAYSDTVGTAFSPAVDNLRQHILLLKNSFATALRPVIEAIIPVIIQLVDWLARAADFVAQVLSVITGKVDDNGRYTKAVLGDLEKSNKEAKELRRTLLGFDEINRLDGDTGKGTSAAASTQFVKAEVSPEATKWAKIFKSIDWGKVAIAAGILAEIFAFIKGGGIVRKFAELAGHIGSFVAAHPALTAIVAALTAMAIWGDKISAFFADAKKKSDAFFDSLDTGNVKTLRSFIDLSKDLIGTVLDAIGTISSMVYKLVHGDFKGALDDLVHLVAIIVAGIVNIAIDAINIVLGAVSDVINAILKVVTWLWNEGIQPVLNAIVSFTYNKVIVPIQNGVINLVTSFLKAIQDGWNSVAGFLNEKLNWVIEKINGLIRWVNDKFGADIGEIPLDVIPTISDEAIDKIESTKLKPIEEEIIPKIKEAPKVDLTIKAKLDAKDVENWINNVLGRVNAAAASLTNAATLVPTSVSQRNKTFVGLYASGGFPTAGSLFVAGEAGPELVANIGGDTGVWNSDQLVQGMYSAFSAALAANPSGGDIYLDGEVIYKNTVRRNNNAVRATGRSALLT